MPRRLIAAAAVGRVLCAASIVFASTLSFAAGQIVERCGLGPAPGSADFSSYNEERDWS